MQIAESKTPGTPALRFLLTLSRIVTAPFRWLVRKPSPRVSRWVIVVLLVMYGFVAFMLPKGDSLNLSAAGAASASHRYGLLSFEIKNFMDKWTHRVYTAMPWTDTSTDRESGVRTPVSGSLK